MSFVMKKASGSRQRITVEEYYRMAEVGLLAPDARVELIDGVIVDMPTIGSRHACAVGDLYEIMRSAGGRAILRVQQPLHLGNLSVPVPDLVLAKPRNDRYKSAHPTATDALLVIEVGETSLRKDLNVKVLLYARHDILEVWVIDLTREQLHCFRSPAAGAYASSACIDKPGLLTVAALPDFTADLSDIF
jgi:Uma2 family endonuclease